MMHKNLKQRISEILYFNWDPIGVKSFPWSRDEYDYYIPWIIELLDKHSDIFILKEYLSQIETQEMWLTWNQEHNNIISIELIDLYNYLVNN